MGALTQRAAEVVLRWLRRAAVRSLGGKCQRCGATDADTWLLVLHDGLWCRRCLAKEEPDFFEEDVP